MKTYLSLIPISAKIHRKQNRMTQLCIIFAVFLVTTVSSMADMGIRMEKTRLLSRHGDAVLQGLGSNPLVQTLFAAAVLLFVLILAAGVMMISSSINSNVAQRTMFFGMMRCIGMSRQQIMRFVRLEALNWCKTAIPSGISLGIITTWGLCALLRFLVGGEFSVIPLFGISLPGIASGMAVGVVTVLIAASSPAKRAASVSPVSAVSGNADNAKNTAHAANTRYFKVETALGFHHAVTSKKNLLLMTGSFALSIILFLSFSVLIQFVGHLMPQWSNTSDIDISSSDGSNSIDSSLLDEISSMAGVKRVFGRRSSFGVPSKIKNGSNQTDTVDLISFDAFDLDCLSKDKLLQKGSNISKVYGDSDYVLAVFDAGIPLKTGDKIQVENEELEIAGMLRLNPFSNDGKAAGNITLITSGETFRRLTGETGYSLLMIQTTRSATDSDVAAISRLSGSRHRFYDRREQRTAGTYLAFQMFLYGFLTIITLVAILNIMNSISMSVSARIQQYGAMRAVGMDGRQITKMIAAEAFTYALSGCAVGCTAGLWINSCLFHMLIASHFSYAAWRLPLIPLAVILLFVFTASVASVYAPSKRIRDMSVAETIKTT